MFEPPFSSCDARLDLEGASIYTAQYMENSEKQRESGNNRQFLSYFLEDVVIF